MLRRLLTLLDTYPRMLRFVLLACLTLLLTVGGVSAQTVQSSTAEPTISIASFNLRVFGKAKASNPQVMNVLSDIIDRYDVVAVQEIRDKSGTAIQTLLQLVDSKNGAYKMVIGPREGRTSSKEQYALIYDSSKLQLVGTPYVFPDGLGAGDLFEREPFLAYFKAVQGDFDFVLGDIHTKPSAATQGIADLPLVIADAVKHYQEPDVLIVGDFNADGSYFNEGSYQSDFPVGKFIWLIGNGLDTNVASSDETYDRMVGTETMAQDYTGKSGTLRFDEVFDLQAMGLKPLDVSDHWPVWARFYADRDTD